MMGKLRGIVRTPDRPVSIHEMNEVIATAAIEGEWHARLQLDKHQRSLALHRLIADRLRANPALLAVARENLTRWMPMNRHAQARIAEWQTVIEQGLDSTLTLITDPGEHATDMRQLSPFTRVLTNTERRDFLAAWRASHPHARRSSKL